MHPLSDAPAWRVGARGALTTFGTAELAESVLAALDGRAAALMSNHGAVTYGADLDAAVERALLLEWACTVYWRAASLGDPRLLDVYDQQAAIAAFASSGSRVYLRPDR